MAARTCCRTLFTLEHFVVEGPATASASGPLGAYPIRQRLVAAEG